MAAVGFVSSILTFPMYAAWLSPTSFGIVTTIRVIIALAQSVSGAGMIGGMFRFLAEESGRQHTDAGRSILWTGFVATIVPSVIVAVLIGLVAVVVLPRTLGGSWILGLQLEAAALALTAFYEIALYAARALNRSRYFVTLYLFNAIASVGFTVLFVVGFRWDAYGVFWADFVSSLILLPPALLFLSRDLGRPQFSFQRLRRMARFGLLIVPAQLGDWILTFSDRLFVQALAGPAQLGVYSLGYRLGTVEQQLVIGGFQLAWDPFVLNNLDEPQAPKLFGITATYILAVSMLPVVLLGTLAGPLLVVMHAKAGYAEAPTVVFLVALASWFGFARYIFVTPTSVKLRSEWSLLVTVVTACVNLALNFPLIRAYGMIGAAWATLIAYAFGAVAAVLVGRRIWTIDLEYNRLVAVVFAATLTYCGSLYLHFPTFWMDCGLKAIGAPLAFLTILTATGFWKHDEREFALVHLRRYRRAAESQG